MEKKLKTKKVLVVPTTADAERWIDPDHFIYQGKVWVIKQRGGDIWVEAETQSRKP